MECIASPFSHWKWHVRTNQFQFWHSSDGWSVCLYDLVYAWEYPLNDEAYCVVLAPSSFIILNSVSRFCMLYSLSPRLHTWWSFFLIAKYVQVSSEHSISLFQKSKIQQFPQHFMSVPCSSFCGIILMISFYLHICLVFLANTKCFASWSIDRSEHNSWYKPNTLKIFLRFTNPMRGVSGDSHEWLSMSSSGRLWGEWVETRKYVWWRGNGSLNGRFVANIEEIYGLIDPKAPAWTWRWPGADCRHLPHYGQSMWWSALRNRSQEWATRSLREWLMRKNWLRGNGGSRWSSL